MKTYTERGYADGGTVRDENGLAAAHVVGQDEDNSDTVLLAAAIAMLAALKYLKPLVMRCGNEDDADAIREAIEVAQGALNHAQGRLARQEREKST